MAAKSGKCFTPHQWHKTESAMAFCRTGRKWNKYTLPDITIWSAPGEHHEIKHKNATRAATYGLEVYRFEALLDFAIITQQKVFYTIHDHDLAGGKDVKKNDMGHWVVAQIGASMSYGNSHEKTGFSWVNGIKKEVPILYWSKELFSKLYFLWAEPQTTQEELF